MSLTSELIESKEQYIDKIMNNSNKINTSSNYVHPPYNSIINKPANVDYSKISKETKDIYNEKTSFDKEEISKKETEAVNHPSHYGGESNPYEVIKVIEAWNLDFCLGNAIKYIGRAGRKDKDKYIEDLEKAKWYIERAILESKND